MAIGTGILRRVSNEGDSVWHSKYTRPIEEFPQGLGVYTFCGYAIPADEWDRVWEEDPEWFPKAYMLLANRVLTAEELVGMEPEDVELAYDGCSGDDFDHCYYTEA